MVYAAAAPPAGRQAASVRGPNVLQSRSSSRVRGPRDPLPTNRRGAVRRHEGRRRGGSGPSRRAGRAPAISHCQHTRHSQHERGTATGLTHGFRELTANREKTCRPLQSSRSSRGRKDAEPESLGLLHIAVERKHDRPSVLRQRASTVWQDTPDWRFHRHVVANRPVPCRRAQLSRRWRPDRPPVEHAPPRMGSSGPGLQH